MRLSLRMSCPPVLSGRKIDGTSAPIRRSWETAVIGGQSSRPQPVMETPMRRADDRDVPWRDALTPRRDDVTIHPPRPPRPRPLDSWSSNTLARLGRKLFLRARRGRGAKRGPVWTTWPRGYGWRTASSGETRGRGTRADAERASSRAAAGLRRGRQAAHRRALLVHGAGGDAARRRARRGVVVAVVVAAVAATVAGAAMLNNDLEREDDAA